MSKVVFFLLKLKPEVAKDDFERWVREVDYPTAASVESIISYRVHRLEGVALEKSTNGVDAMCKPSPCHDF